MNRKAVLCIAFGLFAISLCSADNTSLIDRPLPAEKQTEQTTKEANEKTKFFNACWIISPLSMILAPITQNAVEVNLGSIWAFSRNLQTSFIYFFDYGFRDYFFNSEIQLALSFNPLGTNLRGPLVTAIVSYSTFSDYLKPSAISLMPQVGYEWALDSGLFLAGYLGHEFTLVPSYAGSVRYGIYLGLAYNTGPQKRDSDRSES